MHQSLTLQYNISLPIHDILTPTFRFLNTLSMKCTADRFLGRSSVPSRDRPEDAGPDGDSHRRRGDRSLVQDADGKRYAALAQLEASGTIHMNGEFAVGVVEILTRQGSILGFVRAILQWCSPPRKNRAAMIPIGERQLLSNTDALEKSVRCILHMFDDDRDPPPPILTSGACGPRARRALKLVILHLTCT